MFCEQCGAQIKNGNQFCTQCGASVGNRVPGASEEHVRIEYRAPVAISTISEIGWIDWAVAGAALLLFVSLFIPWVVGTSGGGDPNVTSGPNFGWLTIICFIAIAIIIIIKILPVDIRHPSAAICLYLGLMGVLVVGLVMVYRPLKLGVGTMSYQGMQIEDLFLFQEYTYPFVGAWIALVACVAIVVFGSLAIKGIGLRDNDIPVGEPRRETAEYIGALSALLLFIALFLPWVAKSYDLSGEVKGSISSALVSGANFGWASIISVLLIAAVIVLNILHVDLPFPDYMVYLVAGGFALLVSLLMIAIRPFSTPHLASFGKSFFAMPYIGAYLAAFSSIGMCVSGVLERSGEKNRPGNIG